MIDLKFLQNQTFLVVECIYLFILIINRVFYELATGKKAFCNNSNKGGWEIY